MTLDNVVDAINNLNTTCTFIGIVLSGFFIIFVVMKWSKL